jgi:arylsulfatase
VQLGNHWFVREPGFKLNEKSELFDMRDAPFAEKPVAPTEDTDQSKAARQRLAAALAELNSAGGKTDEAPRGGVARRNAGKAAEGPWKSGDILRGANTPDVAGKPLEISADVDAKGTEGVIVAQGGAAHGYAIYLKGGKLAFAVREGGTLTTIAATEPLGTGQFQVQATLGEDGAMALLVDGKKVATGKAAGLISQQPRAAFTVGKSSNSAVGEYEPPAEFDGTVSKVHVKAAAAAK